MKAVFLLMLIPFLAFSQAMTLNDVAWLQAPSASVSYWLTENFEGAGAELGSSWQSVTTSSGGTINYDFSPALEALESSRMYNQYTTNDAYYRLWLTNYSGVHTNISVYFKFCMTNRVPSSSRRIFGLFGTSQDLVGMTYVSGGTIQCTAYNSVVTNMATKVTSNVVYDCWMTYRKNFFSVGLATNGIKPSSGGWFAANASNTTQAAQKFEIGSSSSVAYDILTDKMRFTNDGTVIGDNPP